MSPEARLELRHDPSKVAPLDRSTPTTIGRAEGNRLRLSAADGVADHHAVVRYSLSQGWLVCDWQSVDGTYLEGERIRQCRRLSDGDEIRLGRQGPVLLFRLEAIVRGPVQTSAPPAAGAGGAPARPAAGAASTGAGASGAPLILGGHSIRYEQILSAQVRSRPRHPNSFSWWVLVCLGGTVLLPFPWLFWSLEITALAAWIVLGSRKEHELVITLRDGMAHRHRFANRITALSHRNGIRQAIGQSLERN